MTPLEVSAMSKNNPTPPLKRRYPPFYEKMIPIILIVIVLIIIILIAISVGVFFRLFQGL
jgi:subtilase family serine protease